MKCSSCGMSMPELPEDATADEMKCDGCLKEVELIRTTDENGASIWIAFDTENRLDGKPKEAIITLLIRWEAHHGVITRWRRYEGVMTRSEMATTILDRQGK